MDERIPPPGETPVTELGERRRAAVGFVFAVAVMDVLAMGIIIPVLPQLVSSSPTATPPPRRAISALSGWFSG
jgi:hypothetical protein